MTLELIQPKHINKYILEKIEFKKLTEKEWDKFLNYNTILYREFLPDHKVPAKNTMKKDILTEDPENFHLRWIVYSDDQGSIIASLGLYIPKSSSATYQENKNIAFFRITVLKEYRRWKIASELLKLVLEEAKENDITLLQVWTDQENGYAFLQKFQFDKAYIGRENRLIISEINEQLMKDWVSNLEKNNPDTNILFFEKGIPEEYLEDFCETFNSALSAEPMGDLETKELLTTGNRKNWEENLIKTDTNLMSMVTVNPKGKITALTEMAHQPNHDDRKIHQFFTGVHHEFASKGLAKGLKAKMILYIKKHFPEVDTAITGNAKNNAPMLSINERMGYKLHKYSEMYKIKIDKLEKILLN